MKKKKILTVVLTSLLALAVAGALAAPAAHSAEPSVKVLDTTATITDPGWFVSAYNAGFRLYVMHSTAWGTCTPWDRTQTQLKMALDAGLRIAVYTRNAECWEGGIEATGPYREQLEFFALDVELGEPPITRNMVDGVRDMGVRPIVYGIHTHWPLIMGDSSEFSDLPLWDGDFHDFDYAHWTPDLLSPAPVSYGGWNVPGNMRVGVQQKLGQDIGGIHVDLNSFSPDFLR
jgi:hypothetical protein